QPPPRSTLFPYTTLFRSAEELPHFASAKLLPQPEGNSSPSTRRRMHTREALLPDAERIHELISAYSNDGTLLPRTLAEICENVQIGRASCRERVERWVGV